MICIFPYVLVRVGGGSFDSFYWESCETLAKTLAKINIIQGNLNETKLKLSESLLNHIKELSDRKKQNALQNFRRDIFNNRKIKTSSSHEVFELVPTELEAELKNYFSITSEIDILKNEATALYKSIELEVKESFIKLASQENVMNGLIFSSQSLLARANDYIKSQNRENKFTQTEKGLLKYLSRIYTKTSPFSSFTNVCLAKIEDNLDHNFIANAQSSNFHSHLRINSFVFALLKTRFQKDPKFYRRSNVRINPTIRSGKLRYKFLTNKNNFEVFQHVERNPLLDFIYSILKNQTPIQFSDMIVQLTEAVDGSENELENYLLKLIESGFLETHIGIPNLDTDWDTKLISLLERLDITEERLFLPLASILKSINSLKQNYQDNDIPSRIRQLDIIFENLERYLLDTVDVNHPMEETNDAKQEIRFDQPNQKSKTGLIKEKIFFDDTTRDLQIQISHESLNLFITKLNSLLNSLKFTDGCYNELERMKIYFKAKYKLFKRISVLKFYEDYYRDFKLVDERIQNLAKLADQEEAIEKEIAEDKNYRRFQKIINSDPDRRSRINSLQKWRKNLQDKIDQFKYTDVLNINLLFIQNTLNDLKIQIPSKLNKSVGYGGFFQFFLTKGQLKGVVNSTGPGYGRMLGRFLHLFSPEVTDLLTSKYNFTIDDSIIYAEGTDASLHNANLHPPLLDREIWIPGSNNSLPVDKQISVSDLLIEYNSSKDELQLLNRSTAKQVYVLDLGFQGELGRSKLFQLLTKFTAAPMFGTQNFVGVVHDAIRQSQANKKVIYIPRIVYEEQIILARARWEIQLSELPSRNPGEEDQGYFFRIHQWRSKLKMPSEVFVSLNPMRVLKIENGSKITPDDYKPQYINFLVPQFIKLFASLMEKKPKLIKIEEMLPDSNHLLKSSDKRYVSEYIVNWYN